MYINFKRTGIFSFTLVFIALVGCDKEFLETEPLGNESSATFWKTQEDAVIATNNLYNYLYDTEIVEWESISDIVAADISSHGLTEIMYARGQQQSDNPYGEDIWINSYNGIRAVNDVLANVDRVENIDPELLARLKGEARFIRAYLYSYLSMFFGDVPLVTEPLEIDEAKLLSRTNKEEVWDFIADDLQEISEDLPVSYDNANKGRISKGAALAMKARAMLWAGRYEEAKNAARAVIDLNEYNLYPNYKTMFTYEAENNQEVILDKQFIRDTYSNNIFFRIAPNSQNSATSDFYPTAEIVDAYETTSGLSIDDPSSGFDPRNPYENRDPRLDYSVFVYGDELPNGQTYDPRPGFGGLDDVTRSFETTGTGFNIKKYINVEDLNSLHNSGINIILIRYADVLLMYAEAKIELGETDEDVHSAINMVRQRPDVDMPPLDDSLSQDALRQAVRQERLVELAFEGSRFFDIRRWEIAPEAMNSKIEGLTYVDQNGDLKTYYVSDYQLSFQAPRDYVWPIPQKEMELNPNYVQNAGY